MVFFFFFLLLHEKSICLFWQVLLVLSLREQNNHLINIVDYDKPLFSVFSLLRSCEWD